MVFDFTSIKKPQNMKLDFFEESGWEDYVDEEGAVYSSDMKFLRRVPHEMEGSYVVCRQTEYIDIDAFNGCSQLTKVFLPKNVETIRNRAFEGCSSLRFINIPDRVCFINEYTFNGCTSLESIGLPSSVIAIGCGAFKDCRSLEYITMPSSLKKIGKRTFDGCVNLKRINLWYDGLDSIEDEAFKDCAAMELIVIPSSISHIGERVFDGCISLKKVFLVETGQNRYTKLCHLFPKNIQAILSKIDISKWDVAYNLNYRGTFENLPDCQPGWRAGWRSSPIKNKA